MYDLTTSIVVAFERDIEHARHLIACLKKIELNHRVYLVDNTGEGSAAGTFDDPLVEYVINEEMLGYGAAHNRALMRSLPTTRYHLVVNSDITFDEGTLEHIFSFMENHQEIGLLMPKILYPDGSLQYLCKLLPRPSDLMLRRFLPFQDGENGRTRVYEMRFSGYDRIMEVPYLSGCFMFMSSRALRNVGLFDERFVLYLEDTDLCRRIHEKFKTVFFPKAQAVHHFDRGSYKSTALLKLHIQSAIKYFNKWGWFFDRKRREINEDILMKLYYHSESSR